jgi:ATP-binding cassette, subfamily F, member 3
MHSRWRCRTSRARWSWCRTTAHLLRATCDRFILVDHGRVEPFDGDLEDYRDWLAAQRTEAGAAARCPERGADKAGRKAEREQAAAERQARLSARRPLVKERDQLERRLEGWQSEKKRLDARLADPGLYTADDPALLQDLLKRQAELALWIDEAELRWIELEEVLESMPAE